MATKTITITEDAYNKLALDKRDNESFSEEIIRWASVKKRPDLRQFAGMWSDWSDKEIQDLKDSINNMRKTAFKSRFKELEY
jgi:predicted CopG family antitoxin